MTTVATGLSFALSALLYAASSVLFFAHIARGREPTARAAAQARVRFAPLFLAGGAVGHAVHVTVASFIAHVCPVHSVHFMLSMAALFASVVYLLARRRFNIDALGILVAPLSLAFLLGTFFLGKPGPEPHLEPSFIAMHVLANLAGVALFLLAGCAAVLYLVQDKRLKQKKRLDNLGSLPPLDALDRAEHWFLLAGFPLLTLGIVTGTVWARKLEEGLLDDVLRTGLGYATWLLFGGVLLLRVGAGWRGRRSAYGTIAGLGCAVAVVVFYLVRPALALPGLGG